MPIYAGSPIAKPCVYSYLGQFVEPFFLDWCISMVDEVLAHYPLASTVTIDAMLCSGISLVCTSIGTSSPRAESGRENS